MVDRNLACLVWVALEAGESVYALGDEGSGLTSKRTAQRLKTAKDGFEGQSPVADIAKTTGWSEKRVQQVRGWWQQSQAVQGGSPLLIDIAKEHHADLQEALRLLKDYLEPIAGEVPLLWLPPCEPTPMGKIHVDDLQSHLEDKDLIDAIDLATTEGPPEPRKTAAVEALRRLREVLAGRLIGGHCRHCPVAA